MKLEFLFFLILLASYFLHNLFLTMYFKKKFKKNDYFIGKNAPNEMQKFFGKLFYLIIVYYILILAYLFTGFDFWGLISNISIIDTPIFKFIGFVVGIIFIILMTAARLNLRSSWRVGLDPNTKDKLVKTGFYKFMRNPYFAFLLIFQFSLILTVPDAITLFAFIQSYLLINLQIMEEEEFLKEKYGEDYIKYKKNTGRFIPKLH